VCPQQQKDFSQILTHVDDLKAPGVTLVSFSVDPEFDTPAVLKTWGDKMGVDSSRWKLATGPEAAVKELLTKRMFVDMGERTPLPNDLFDISHASKFVLVDQNGDVRGYWGTDELARGNLINAARMLFKRGPQP
jgi:protein SCO1/2